MAAPDITVPIQIQVGSNDLLNLPGIPNPPSLSSATGTVGALYMKLTGTKATEWDEIMGGDHVGFLDEWAAELALPLSGDGSCTIGFATQRQDCSGSFTPFLSSILPP